MCNAQVIKERVREQQKAKGIKNSDEMMEELNLGVNIIRQMSDKKGVGCFALAKIADYLDCSVDYLLGRTDNPNITADTYIKGNNNGVQAISNGTNSTLTINGTPHSTDKSTAELVELVESLPLVKKAEAIIYLNKLKTNS